VARRLAVQFALSISLAGAFVLGVFAQQAPPTTPPAVQTPAPTSSPRPTPPDVAAMNAALAVRDAAEKLTALEKFKSDFPTSSLLSTADSQMLSTLATMPGRAADVPAALDQVLARIPENAAPETRLSMVLAAATSLVNGKVMLDRAESLVSGAMKTLDFNDYAERQRTTAKNGNRPEPATETLRSTFDTLYRGRALELLGRIYTANGDTAKAETTYRDLIKAVPSNGAAALSLARLEQARGDDAAALEHFLAAKVAGSIRTVDDDKKLADLFVKVRGNAAGMEDAIDRLYRSTFPNPVTPESYKPSEKRTDRVVLLEMFTGSGCPPCVSADLAMDAAMERYSSKEIIAIAYHQNIPAPDPMVVAGGVGRKEYYAVSGVPTFNIDGAMGQVGGGARTATPNTYAGYVKSIDQALEQPSQAAIAVRATASGDAITVKADVSKMAADITDARLHLVVVERELKFIGENGIRFHPMVVRAVAGERGAGLPIAGNGTTEFSFSLAAIRKDIEATLTAEMEKRRKDPANASRDFSAEGHAMTHIDAGDLMVVAFVQRGAFKKDTRFNPAMTNVLQATAVSVTHAASGTKSGGR